MKRRNDDLTINLEVKYNDLYDLWDHLVGFIMQLDDMQTDLSNLVSVIYDVCREHENDSPAKAKGAEDLLNDLFKEDCMKEPGNSASEAQKDDEEVEGESLAVELLKAVFDCLEDICEKGKVE